MAESLEEYIERLITPPEAQTLVVEDMTTFDWASLEDASVPSILLKVANAHDWHSEENAQEVMRVLKPGGYVAVIPPEDDKYGYKGACALEDAGMQVRDSITVLDDPDEFTYCPKPSQKEKNRGLEGKNTHPTVKPIKMMKKLIEKCSLEGFILDPFLGSGTTGVAAQISGRPFIGMELSDEYIDTAKRRVNHAKTNPKDYEDC
jgi:hypothetical protein